MKQHPIRVVFGLIFLLSQAMSHPGDLPDFRAHVIDDDFQGGYQVSSADLNGDGLPDVIGLSTNPTRFVWYENPEWNKYVLTSQTNRNIDVAPYDINNDGRPDLALASDFDLGNSFQGGRLHWLLNPANPTLEWLIYRIGAEPTAHRIRWADLDGNGRKELVNVPIIGPGATHPRYSTGAHLQWYGIPDNPAAEEWTVHTIDTSLHMIHGVAIVDWDNDFRDDILTASFEGIHLFRPSGIIEALNWHKIRLGVGKSGPRPQRGSSEVALGHLGVNRRFLGAIEPWHGFQVVIYNQPAQDPDSLWHRTVIDSSFQDGHALETADLNGDGLDEVIAGYRGEPYHLYIYSAADTSGEAWQRFLLDAGGMGAAGLYIVDLDKDGDQDILAIGTNTGNIKWYENLR